MIKGFHTSTAGMLAQQKQMDILTNNLSNVQTPGYKSEQASMRAFPQLLIRSYEQQTIPDNTQGFSNGTIIGRLNSGVYVQETTINHIAGALKETTLPTDVALVEGLLPTDEETGTRGALYFTVQTPDGETRYTKNGNFHLNANNQLVTSQGFLVLGANNQPIQVQSPNFRIDAGGGIWENEAQRSEERRVGKEC